MSLIFSQGRRGFGLAALTGLMWMVGAAGGVHAAESYPSRPIQLVVPFSAGGPVDATARFLGQKLSEALGQPVVVNNRPGGDTIIAADSVARSPGDGYTLLLTSNQHSINPALRPLSYDPDKNFVPVTMVAVTPILLVAHPAVPANTVSELIELLKANPDRYFYGSAGAGSSQHLTAELFKAATGTEITHIPFKGTAPATVALLSGDVQLSFATPTTTIPHVETGKLKVLATTTAERSVQVPNVPTLAESGVPGFDASAWIGLLASGGTSRAVVDTLYEAMARILQADDVRETLLAQGIETVQMTPDAFADFLRTDREQAARIVKEAAIEVN